MTRRALIASLLSVATVLQLAPPASAARRGALSVRPGHPASASFPALVGDNDDDAATVLNFAAACSAAGPCDIVPVAVDGARPPAGQYALLDIAITWDAQGGTDRLSAQVLDPAHEGPGDYAVFYAPKGIDGRMAFFLPDPSLNRYDLLVNNVVGANTGYRVEVGVRFESATTLDLPTGADAERPASARAGRGATGARAPSELGTAGQSPTSPLRPDQPFGGGDRFGRIRPLSASGRHANGAAASGPWALIAALVVVALLGGIMANRRLRRALTRRTESLGRFRDVGLFWKLLVPFLVVIFVIGVTGAFVTVRYLSSRADTTLDQNLLQRSVGAQTYLRDQELYLLEAERFAANIEGVPEATAARNQPELARDLASAIAVRKDLDVLSATDRAGVGIVDYVNNGGSFTARAGVVWGQATAVHDALAGVVDSSGDKRTGFVRLQDGTALLLTAGPIKTDSVVGATVAGLSVEKLAAGAAGRAGAGVGLYDGSGDRMGASSKSGLPGRLPADVTGRSVRRRRGSSAVLYEPLVVRGQQVGTIATRLSVGSAYASVRGAALRLGLLVLCAMGAIVGLGVIVTRYILRSLKPLVATNRALAAGDLSARTPVLGHDELGELAEGVNQMAAALEESHQTLETRVDERTAEVRRLLQERTDFFTAVSHEFRTPLAIILSRARMLDDEVVAEDLKAAGTQLLGFVNDILDIAKADAGSIDIDQTEVSVEALIDTLRPQVQALASDSGLRCSFECEPDLPPVLADERRVREILLNLIDNAVKYTPRDGDVSITVNATGEGVAIAVADTGVGIPEEAAARIFEPFFRVKGTVTQNGQPSSGLGLALVKRLVELQSGTVSFVSSVGRGSTFTVAFPAAPGRDVPRTRTSHRGTHRGRPVRT